MTKDAFSSRGDLGQKVNFFLELSSEGRERRARAYNAAFDEFQVVGDNVISQTLKLAANQVVCLSLGDTTGRVRVMVGRLEGGGAWVLARNELREMVRAELPVGLNGKSRVAMVGRKDGNHHHNGPYNDKVYFETEHTFVSGAHLMVDVTHDLVDVQVLHRAHKMEPAKTTE